MGLFSKKEKKSFEECLEQRSGKVLREHAESELKVWTNICDVTARHVCVNLPYEDGTDSYTAPIFGPSIECLVLFEAAAHKGDSLGAFYAAIFYEHGIGTTNNQSKANECYDMATALGGVCAELSDIIKSLKNDMWFMRKWCDDEVETLALDMMLMQVPSSHLHKYIADRSEEARAIFLKITSYLLWFYAQNNSPWARGWLGLIIVNYDTYSDKEFYKFKISGSKDKRQKFAVELLKTVVIDAQNGNKYAHNFCQDRDLYNKLRPVFEENYY